MRLIADLLNQGLKFRTFRILLARIYPFLKKFKIIEFLQKLNKGSLSDPFDHVVVQNKGLFRTYDLEGFDTHEALKKYTIDAENLLNLKKEYNFGFLLDSNDYDLKNIKDASKALKKVEYTIYDIKSTDLIEKLNKSECDGIIIYPTSANIIIRNAFHEVSQIIASETNLKIYPTLNELNIYESKRTLAYFLQINNIPHPATFVFYDSEKAKIFLETCKYPIIFKTHFGASASGVEILKNKRQAQRMVKQLFLKYYLRKLETERRNMDWGYMILQEYIEDVKEYRIIKVGDSWFGYQKWKNESQTFLSGSGKQKFIKPSEELLEFCYNIAEKQHFTTMSFDIFENKQGKFLVNELQTWFGSYDPSEMYINNIPGRYRKIKDKWTFEPGFFNVYGSNLLRITHFISILQGE
jgi:glutathione synthase/RimK-type ligase-like ATP-grasp enzyme